MKDILIIGLSCLCCISFISCDFRATSVQETQTGYQITENTNLVVILKTPLNSNVNQRGDQFISELKNPIIFRDKPILPESAQIRGLVKRVTKFQRLGDRAGLLLLFDQIVFPDGRKIPIVASLDTDEGEKVIKIKGKAVQNAKVVGSGALVGTILGKEAFEEHGAQKGLVIGTTAGVGAVILSNMKEVKLPEETELIIKLDEPLLIPK